MSRIYLFRHGQSEANTLHVFSSRKHDVSLVPHGIEQVRSQAARFADLDIGTLYVSPLQRARQTAAFVEQSSGCSMHITEALLEVDVGDLDGCRADEQEAWVRYDAVREEWGRGHHHVAFPGGESLVDVEARLRPLLDDVAKAREPVVLVGHGMLFMTLLWLFCANRAPTLQGNYMGNAHLSVLRQDESGLHIEHFDVAPGEAT